MIGAKSILQDYLNTLRMLPAEDAELFPVGEDQYYGDSEHDLVTSPFTIGNLVVFPAAQFNRWLTAWESAQSKMTDEQRVSAIAQFGAASPFNPGLSVNDSAAFFTWFIPLMQSYTALYWLLAAAGAAGIGGLIYASTSK